MAETAARASVDIKRHLEADPQLDVRRRAVDIGFFDALSLFV